MKEKLNGYGRTVVGVVIGILATLALLAPNIMVHGQRIERNEADIQGLEDAVIRLVEEVVPSLATDEDLAQLKADLIRELGK